jgi:hypothetical protein
MQVTIGAGVDQPSPAGNALLPGPDYLHEPHGHLPVGLLLLRVFRAHSVRSSVALKIKIQSKVASLQLVCFVAVFT